MPPLQLNLFGMPQLEVSGQPIRIERRKALALAAYLALNPQAQSRDVLATLLWPDGNHEQGRASLRSTLSTLAKATDEIQWIDANRQTIGLRHEAVRVDVIAYRTALKEAAAHDHTGETLCEACVTAYTTAVDLYRDDFMHGFYLSDSPVFEEWQLLQRDTLRRDYMDAQRRLSTHYTASGQFEPALAHAQKWLACDPLQESAHRQLMRLYAATGQRAGVQRQYEQCVEILDDAFVTPPESETTQLFESLMQRTETGTPDKHDAGDAPVLVIPPLPSLVIGREAVLQEIKTRLGVGERAASPFTVIHGWPGVGKSTITAMLTHDDDINARFPDGILWASLGETPDLLTELSGWASAMGLHNSSQTHKLDDLSAQVAALVRDKQLLLIVDDVWQVDHVRPFRIGGPDCVTLMTSRLFDVALSLAPTAADVYRLPVLSEQASLELLGKLTPETVKSYPDEARQLVNDLEGLPLAIHVAGRLLHTESAMGWGIKDLLDELRVGAELLAAQPPSDVLIVGRDASPTVTALLNRSTGRLTPEMRLRFALLGLFVPKPATFDLNAVAVAWDMDDPRPAIRTLVSHGLLEPISGGRFQMHALLVLHAKSLLETEFGG